MGVVACLGVADEEVLGSADKAMSDMLVKNWTPFRSKIKTQPGLALRRAVAANPPPPPPKVGEIIAQFPRLATHPMFSSSKSGTA